MCLLDFLRLYAYRKGRKATATTLNRELQSLLSWQGRIGKKLDEMDVNSNQYVYVDAGDVLGPIYYEEGLLVSQHPYTHQELIAELDNPYSKLNVLRWLACDAQGRTTGDMPALDKERPSSNTLALHYAAARGCMDCVRLLVDSSPEISANTQMDNDVTPVYLAAQEGHLDVLKFLVLEAGGSLYVRAKDGMAPLHAASQMGCLNCVKWMIQEQGVDPNLRDGDGATPLHFAASRGHLETVRWLLRHGARLSLDKYGKSPINDAAENQQVECLNVLVQHGTTPDYNDNERGKNGKPCSCARKSEKVNRSPLSPGSDCSTCPKSPRDQEPFYLHPPSQRGTMEAPHAPQDGLYINPMNNHRHSASSNSSSSGESVSGESFYLHNPQEVIYNRVKDLFDTNPRQPPQRSALTVHVEVHSSSSGAGSDENLSSSDLSERSADHEHDYEDIYLVCGGDSSTKTSMKDRSIGVRSRSRDSGSHSRSGSASSSNSGCNVIVKVASNKEHRKLEKTNNSNNNSNNNNISSDKADIKKKDEKCESGLSSSPSDLCSEDENEKVKLSARHSLPQKAQNTRPLKRVVSVPVELNPPPPPPPLPGKESSEEEVLEEPTVKPSEVVKSMCKTMSTVSTKRLNSSCSDLTIVSLNDSDEMPERTNGPNLVNKQRVLPFIPPSFPGSGDSNALIKPSEYLRSISDKKVCVTTIKPCDYEDATTLIVTEEKKTQQTVVVVHSSGPPPPPLPANLLADNSQRAESTTETAKKQLQPLAAISIQDLNSVQLRRTDKIAASKTFSAPTRSMSLQCLQSEPYLAQKTDLIAELKMSKDITGIRKMKVERAKVEEKNEKEMFSEITKQFTANNFVEKIPDRDNTGNMIPAWKRQMLAKKAAEKARKELELQLQREAEEKRLQAIPQWKRQLLAKREEAEIKIKSTIYTPKVVDEIRSAKVHDAEECWRQHVDAGERPAEEIALSEEDNEHCQPSQQNETNEENGCHSDEEKIIPWRAQLRKTNSKLNLLD